MTTEDKKEVRNVVSFFTIIFLLVLGSMIVKFNVIDLIYLGTILLVLIKYILIKKHC